MPPIRYPDKVKSQRWPLSATHQVLWWVFGKKYEVLKVGYVRPVRIKACYKQRAAVSVNRAGYHRRPRALSWQWGALPLRPRFPTPANHLRGDPTRPTPDPRESSSPTRYMHSQWVSAYKFLFTERKISSYWRNFRRWLHRKLSFCQRKLAEWQLSVQPAMKISSKWRHVCSIPGPSKIFPYTWGQQITSLVYPLVVSNRATYCTLYPQ